MPIKLIEYKINKHNKILQEAGVKDFFKGLAQGASDTFKKELGIKTKEELAQEAEQAYGNWFSSKGFKEIELNEEDIFKAYILPLGKADEGIIFKFKLTKDAKKYIEGKTDDEIKDDPNVTTECTITMFDVPIDLDAMKTLAPTLIGDRDFNGIDTLIQKEHATLTQGEPLKPQAKEYLDNLNQTFLKGFKINLFDTQLSTFEKSAFQSLIKDGKTDGLDDIVTTQIANNLSRKQESLETLKDIGDYGNVEEMAKNFAEVDKQNEALYNAIANGSDYQEISDIINDRKKSTYDYQYRMLVMAISHRLNNGEMSPNIQNLLKRSKIRRR